MKSQNFLDPKGTLVYMAPEIIMMEHISRLHKEKKTNETPVGYNVLCDVWSIGCIAYSLVTQGELPFHPDLLYKVSDKKKINVMYYEH